MRRPSGNAAGIVVVAVLGLLLTLVVLVPGWFG
jgi:hypothetical protein